jgi:hypothetical protein
MARCWKCGAELVQGATFCHKCGASVRPGTREEFSVSSEDLIQKIKELVNEGKASRLLVKDDRGKVLLEIPVTAGVVGVLLAPWLAAAGAVAAVATKCTIVVERNA